jgi:DNA-binding IclR family transcriptional regulator
MLPSASTVSVVPPLTRAQKSMPPSSMIQRMTLIMDAFEHLRSQLTLEEIATRTSLPRSTTYRILDQLVRSSWLERSAATYYLGQRAFHLGDRWSLRAAAAPHLHELAIRTEMVVHLAILDRNEVYLLDKVSGGAPLNVPTMVGSRLPAHCTAVGKAMLASLHPEEIDAHYEGGMTRCTTHSIGTLGGLHRELATIRARNRLAVDYGECFADLACVGMALRRSVGAVAAISVTSNLRNPALDRVAPMISAAVRKVASDLGDNPDSAHGSQTPVGRTHKDIE